MIEYTLLTTTQASGDTMLDVLKKSTAKSHVSDFAIIHGSYITKEKTCWWWTSPTADEEIHIINESGEPVRAIWCIDGTTGGIRPTFDYSLIASPMLSQKRNTDGVLEVEYGEYPQSVVDDDLSRELEKAYKLGKLLATGKTYTTNKTSYRDKVNPFVPQKNIEYEYNGKKYVRVLGDHDRQWKQKELVNGRIVKNGEPYWIEVEPIIWLIDEKTKTAVSKRILCSGIKMNKYGEDFPRDFSETDIKKFLDKHFSQEIFTENDLTYFLLEQNKKTSEVAETIPKKTRIQKMNPDTTDSSKNEN